MAAHARLKNEFTEGEKYHNLNEIGTKNLMTFFVFCFRRFHTPIGLSEEEQHQRQIYTKILEFEQEEVQMSLVTRKPVFGLCDQVRLKLACAVTEAM